MNAPTLNPTLLSLDRPKAWLLAAAFTVGNMLLPQLCHLMPQGGLIFLPIYLFTLISMLSCGWQVGLLVALVTPMVNSIVFGMPDAELLPIIITKGFLIVGAVVLARRLFAQSPLLLVVFAVLSYQLVGCAIESLVTGNASIGFQDLRLGLPGIAIQIVAGYLYLRFSRK